jgi:hypothetical protein
VDRVEREAVAAVERVRPAVQRLVDEARGDRLVAQALEQRVAVGAVAVLEVDHVDAAVEDDLHGVGVVAERRSSELVCRFGGVVSIEWSETKKITVRPHSPCAFWFSTKRWICMSVRMICVS